MNTWQIETFCVLFRGINMRYLGKVASILSLRADLEHVHVSIILWWHLQVAWATSELSSSSISKRHQGQSPWYENDLLFSCKWNHFHRKGLAPSLIIFLKVSFWNSEVVCWEYCCREISYLGRFVMFLDLITALQ